MSRRYSHIDLSGQTFGLLEVLCSTDERDRGGCVLHKCLCKCGKIKLVAGYALKSGKTSSCGCRVFKDITNEVYGYLTALEIAVAEVGKKTLWKCECKCGNIVNVRLSCLTTGNTTSCGCQSSRLRKGEANSRYNPDREQVELNKKTRWRCVGMLHRCLRLTKSTKTSSTYDMLGYTKDELMQHLEISALEQLKGNHIDHIFPMTAFIKHGITSPKVINSLDNLQLLPAKENMSKKDKYDPEEFETYLTTRNIDFVRPEDAK